MLFEWDQAKSLWTLRERGFGFDYAARVFLGPTLENPDTRQNYGEILFVVYTDRRNARHIISARLASRKERTLWQSFVEQSRASGD